MRAANQLLVWVRRLQPEGSEQSFGVHEPVRQRFCRTLALVSEETGGGEHLCRATTTSTAGTASAR